MTGAPTLGYTLLFLLAGTKTVVDKSQWALIVTGIMAAFSGVMIGKRLLHKITMKTVQTLTGVLLLAIAISLGAGLV